MTDNRYSIDDILRELSEKKPAGEAQNKPRSQPAPKSTQQDDFFANPRQSDPRRPAPQSQPSRSGGWEPVGRTPSKVDARPSAPNRPTRELPKASSEGPRLGQTMQRPRTKEEQDILLSNFGDSSEDTLGNLDFLGETPKRVSHSPREQDFAPAPGRREAPQSRTRYPEPQQSRTQSQPRPSAPPRPDPNGRRAQTPPSAGQQYGGSRYYAGGNASRMQQNDHRSMAEKAARVITGGMDELDDIDEKIANAGGVPAQPQVKASPRVQRPQDRPKGQPQAQPKGQSYAQPPRPSTHTPPAQKSVDNNEENTERITAAKKRATAENQPNSGRQTLRQSADQLDSMRTGLLIRVVVNILALCGVIYLVLANSYALPLPGFLSGSENISSLLWCAVILTALSALVSGNTIGSGVLALLKLRPSNDTYTALVVFACSLQGAYMAMEPQLMSEYGQLLYLPAAVMMLLFNTLGKIIMISRMSSSISLLAGKGAKGFGSVMESREFAKRISGDIIHDEPHVVCFGRAATVDGFLEQAFSESRAEDISRFIAPLAALAALVMALVSQLFSGNLFISASVFTAALCITSPLAGVIASQLPLSVTNGRLARWNASICGYDSVEEMASANAVVLTASQLFPKGSIALQDIQLLGRRPLDQVIIDAASVLCGCDSPLKPPFAEMVQDPSMLVQPENLEYIDGMGISAWVNGRRVLIGNRNLMASFGVNLPDTNYERQYRHGKSEVLYLANSGEVSAMYILSYKVDKGMRRAMGMLCDRDIGVCLYSNDQSLTEEKLSEMFSFPHELLTIIPASMHPGTQRYLAPRQTVPAGTIHNGTPASFLRTLLAARSCSSCVGLEMALILMSVVVGFGIVTILAFTGQMESLTWITLAVFQFFWVIIQLAVPLFKR